MVFLSAVIFKSSFIALIFTFKSSASSIISDNVTARGSFKKITKSIDPVSHNNTIPVGGIYNSNGVTYTAGQPFPEIQDGDTYTYGDYEYKYNYAFNYSSVDPTMTEEQIEKWTPNNSQNGWGVRYNGNKENPEEIITEINNKPITNLDATFAFTNIKVSPTIPNTTKSMYATYICSTLETASTIPENVSDIGMTFTGCVNLGGIIKLNISNDIIYPNDMTFDGTNKPIILTGSYTQVEDFIYNYDNILTENYNLMYVDGFLFRFTPETTWE